MLIKISTSMEADLIFYQFSRFKVERDDFSHFLSLYAADKLPTGRRLRQMMNTMMLGIEGYDDDPREVLCIAEIRRFYTAFREAWPYWLYFCNLDTEAFQMMVMCCLPSLVAMQTDGGANVAVNHDRLELLQFLCRDFAFMNDLCDRAEMSEREIYNRSKALFAYFNLPFEAGQPR